MSEPTTACGVAFRDWEVRAFHRGTKTRYSVPMKTQPPASTRRMVPSLSDRLWLPVVPQVRDPLGCLGLGPLDIEGYAQPIWIGGPMVGDRAWILEVTGLRIRRVQDMGPDDAIAEGCPDSFELGGEYCVDRMDTRVVWFMDYWNRRYARKGLSWDRNPWVIVRDVRLVEDET